MEGPIETQTPTSPATSLLNEPVKTWTAEEIRAFYERIKPPSPPAPNQSPEKRVRATVDRIKALPDAVKGQFKRLGALTEFGLGAASLRIGAEPNTSSEEQASLTQLGLRLIIDSLPKLLEAGVISPTDVLATIEAFAARLPQEEFEHLRELIMKDLT